MIDRKQLLTDLQKLLVRLEADLLQRSESAEVLQVGQTLRADYEQAKAAARTAQNYEDWRSDAITQAAAAWVLSCVFVRFLEDNRLIEPAKIAGPGERLRQARDEWELYLAKTSAPNERDYLLSVFDALAALPGTKDVFGPHNPIQELPNWLSGDAARDLLNFFQKINAETGLLIHDFTDPNWDTRFLGDLYQDLSEAARKKYALLQTPEFVEEFILDRTLDPALDEFGLDAPPVLGIDNQPMTQAGFRMIDPACGSGHFLLGSFRRILGRWQRKEPGMNARVLVQRALDSVHGVDVNPFAIAIARFRLLLAAMRACGITRLADAPAFRLNLVCGDSLLHAPLSAGGKKYTAGQQELDYAMVIDSAYSDECDHAYWSENLPELKRLLRGGQYHAVVANPPYITPKDRQLNERYRKRFASCHRQYSLAVPFMERVFRLAVIGGYTGQITANTFMKAEFGKKLIESFFPTVDLTHVIDTSGVYIPGHGTPTVIVIGRHRLPVSSMLRTVLGIRGEPAVPADPARGLAWSAILAQLDQPGSQSDYVSVGDSSRTLFHKHPWSIGGGGATELKGHLETGAFEELDGLAISIGRIAHTGDDEAYIASRPCLRRQRIPKTHISECIEGDRIRDYQILEGDAVLFPYKETLSVAAEESDSPVFRWLWRFRTELWERREPNGTHRDIGKTWHEFSRFHPERYFGNGIAFAFVATHNHFALDRGGKVFKQTAPVIKLQRAASEEDHLALLGILNSSTACFWIKQVCFPKGGDIVGGEGARVRQTLWDIFYNFNSTPLGRLPLPADRPLIMARLLDSLAGDAAACRPVLLFAQKPPTRRELEIAQRTGQSTRSQMISAQEELDWECYRLYGLIADDLTLRTAPPLTLGQRAFEIVLARKMSAGETQTTWFERHGSTPTTELPKHWPKEYRELVERRIALIESAPNIRLIEQPEYKRRWNTESWESQLERASREWLLDRLESYFDFDGRMNDGNKPKAKLDVGIVSVARLADIARQDVDFMQVGELYRDDPAFDVARLVAELVEAESIPLLPALRYKESGLRKRTEWETTWQLQRQEDDLTRRLQPQAEQLARWKQELVEINKAIRAAEGDKEGEKECLLQNIANLRPVVTDLTEERDAFGRSIPVPPRYVSADFLKSSFWNLRGKLDVPKERWVSFPHCEGADGTLMIAWAGYDHLQLAQAISAHYVDVQERLGGRDDPRLVPLLGCLIELLPWIKQWHNEPDAAFDGMRMGDYFEGFINEEARQLGKTIDEIKAWTPPQRAATRGRRRAAT